MKVKTLGEEPFSEMICNFLQENFPVSLKPQKGEMLEILTNVLIGSKDVRYGPIPKPEALVIIRKTVRAAIEQNAPIPVLVPWGGRKMSPSITLDVAEIAGIRQIIALDEGIKRIYAPGLHIHIAIEDMGAEWLYKDDSGIEEYSDGLVKLVNLLKGSSDIEPIRESHLMLKSDYFDMSHELSELLGDAITAKLAMHSLDVNTIPSFLELKSKGWKGDLDMIQINYYMDRYKALYPEESCESHIVKLADYFAGSLARYKLNGRGEPDSSVGGFIKLSFASPIPGSPVSMFNNTIYYRTVPERYGRTHIAPWRAKGFLEMGDRDVRIKVTQGHGNYLLNRLAPVTIMLHDDEGHEIVDVRADYLMAEEPVILPFHM